MLCRNHVPLSPERHLPMNPECLLSPALSSFGGGEGDGSRGHALVQGLNTRNWMRGIFTRGPRSRAFTLIEIMVVVAIMAIILAAGIPSLYGFFHKEGLRKTTGDILETCQTARSAAILSGSPAELIFHPKEGTCETAGGGKGGYGAWAHSAKLENCYIEMLDVNLQECKDFETVRVRFFPNGTSDEMTLVLRSKDNEWRKISLEITTALPTLEDKIR
jgi:prepilin-type N-terminal cleavage/methylation domain-containing protein